MDFMGKMQPPMENILFPTKKIKPYERPDKETYPSGFNRKDTTKDFVMDKPKTKLHLLEVTEPHLLLQKIFQPYLFLAKISGCLPLRIENGTASFRCLSWNCIYSFFVMGLFIFDTSFYFPIMKHMNSEENRNFLVYVTQIILVVSQIFAALVSYVFMAVRARKVAIFWNRLHAVLVKLVSRCSRLDLVPTYKIARMKIIVWVLFTVVFGCCYIASFQDDIRNYLTKEGYSSTAYYVMFSAFTFYSVLLSIHLLHSTCFTSFICVICCCFRALGNIALKQDGQGNVRKSQDPVLFREISEMYEELIELRRLVGDIYGIYIAMEILAMMICVTINSFFIISNPELSSLFVLNLAIAMPYIIWFHDICLSGGCLFRSMKKCYLSIRKAWANAAKMVPMSEIAHLQIDPPDCLSAAGYFLIDMRLFTTVLGTIATYLVVTLQFRTGMNMNITSNGTSTDNSLE